ncbi:MAG: alkaline phosphatase D family protein [Egibacteraceae bacterium]
MEHATRDPDQLDLFAHGVASGDPLADRVVIWTRVTTDERRVAVRWTMARDEALEDVVVTGFDHTSGERDWTVKVDVPGLEPATAYWYGFEVDGERSPVGRTRTAPAGQTERLRVGFTSCARYIDGFFNVYARMADREDLDLIVHLGDYFYEYGNDRPSAPGAEIGRVHIPDHPCKTLEDYRTRYAQHRLDDDCRRLHALHPWVCVFDDHECVDDRWREGGELHDPRVDGPFEERAAAALQAWYEWLPVRMPDTDTPERIYRRLPLGDLADLIMIDVRSFRDQQATPPAMYAEERELLGRVQHEWLCERLQRSTARWRFVGNPVMVGQVYSNLLPDWLGPPLAELGLLTKDAHGAQPDQWDGYPAARNRLSSFIRSARIRNVVFLSGDVHSGWAVDVMEDPTDEIEPYAVEFVTPSVTSQNLNEKVGEQQRAEGEDVEARIMEVNPHVRWAELDDHGYVLLDIDHRRIRAEWWCVDTVLERSDEERCKAAFEVRDGTSRLYEAEAGADSYPDP